jgi:hypothetical protein
VAQAQGNVPIRCVGLSSVEDSDTMRAAMVSKKYKGGSDVLAFSILQSSTIIKYNQTIIIKRISLAKG